MNNTPLIKRALISVSDKTGIVHLAKQLHQLNVELLATGGTAKILKKNNLPVIDVANYTGFPEILDGRVKTLHPAIHAGLLARGDQDQAALDQHNITPIQLLIINLYPFSDTISKTGTTLNEAIEQIDVGGPSMLRAGAKNHRFVTCLTDPTDYSKVIGEITTQQGTSIQTRQQLAQKVFAKLSQYDQAISNYLSAQLTEQQTPSTTEPTTLPNTIPLVLLKKNDLRYGENPQQAAGLYTLSGSSASSLANASCLQGKPLSYNNFLDAQAAYDCACSLDEPGCAIIKHTTPCGVAINNNQPRAYQQAFQADAKSAFGGIIAFNSELTAKTVEAIISQQFAEVIIAPAIEKVAEAIAKQKPNLRLLICPEFKQNNCESINYQSINGGFLVQEQDLLPNTIPMKCVTQKQPSPEQKRDLAFAWRVAAHTKSNAIVYAKDGQTLGIGSGQTSRILSTQVATLKAEQAQLNLEDSVMASDGFFPFADSILQAKKQNISCIIQPGGSIRDQEVIDCANANGIVMVFTQQRHFKH